MENLSDSLLMILFAFIALCLFVLIGGIIYGLIALPFYAIWRLYKRFRGDPTGKQYDCIIYRGNVYKELPEGNSVIFHRVSTKQKKIIKKGCYSLGYQLGCKEGN
jgi:hypothetical protein